MTVNQETTCPTCRRTVQERELRPWHYRDIDGDLLGLDMCPFCYAVRAAGELFDTFDKILTGHSRPLASLEGWHGNDHLPDVLAMADEVIRGVAIALREARNEWIRKHMKEARDE